ncbi:pre-rRNA processing protein [Elasticomyces elasticus]|uniref:Pre-rRNA processing protein n=1 Tax=Exophiala sideris TaxID=1016849 RepID=A0ABR0J415_9EURO|nr:pre-rRNA processing protein [Elasticomyces elasticus]KAK5026895.1 pre-rRNA processing protein [Exophiala sideris]KAK5033899.1 pre-rRNA processing protein [Exophiala sideris]KAK5055826.1 pre-rRNA processing protein [Exophiala sideris]KAK5180841.1 pre-rRNA processing protein [Eurotiomycetes sp. CCFEE 6388]
MSSFFTVPASQRKRKRPTDTPGKPRKRREAGSTEARDGREQRSQRKEARPRDTERDESISGSDTGDEVEPETGDESEATSEEGETGAERRVRLAQRYLDNIRHEVDEVGFDAEDLDKDLIAQRLKEDADEAKGRQYRQIATYLDFTNATHSTFKADTQSTTGVAVCKPYAYTVSRDKTLIKWLLQTPSTGEMGSATPRRRRPKQLKYVRGIQIRALAPQQHGHTGAILSVAASPDGKYVATGGADKKLIIWAAEDLRPLKTFTTHRDGITGLAFAPTSSTDSGFGAQLFSASMDRSLKTYSLAGEDSLAYVETLFGHQDHIVGVSPVSIDQCVTVGARDRKALWWKVVEESLTRFLGDSSRNDEYQTGSLDCVAALPPNSFVTGSDSGAISLWSVHKKKALFTIQTAHGVDEPPPLEEVTSESDPRVIEELKKDDYRKPVPRGITALAALPGTDIVLSGSWDGWIRVWKLSDDKRSLLPFGTVGKIEENDTEGQGHEEAKSTPSSTSSSGAVAPAGSEVPTGLVNGFINSLAVFERRKEITSEFGGKKEGECQGICIVAGTGKEMRLGRWMKLPRGKNGAIVFEVPLLRKE